MSSGAIRLLLGTCALAASIAGCTATPQSPAEQTEPQLGPIPQLTVVREVTLPLDAYQPTPAQSATIETARDILMRDCMRSFGFDSPVMAHTADTDPGRRYGITDPVEAERHGYRLPPEKAGGKNTPVPGQPRMTQAAQAVLTGTGEATVGGKKVPAGGCAGEADRGLGYDVTVRDGFVEIDNIAQRLVNETRQHYLSDSRVTHVNAQWSACMREAGFAGTPETGEFTNWLDPNNFYSSGPVTPTEIATARADVACKHKHNLAGVSQAVETAHQTRTIERNAEVLANEKSRLDARIRRASELVAAGR